MLARPTLPIFGCTAPYRRLHQNGHVKTKFSGTLAALLLLMVTSCVAEDLGGAFVIVNRSDVPVYLSGKRIAPHGGTYIHGVRSCTRPGFELSDEQGRVVITLEDGACAGQTLTVYGLGDYTLASSEG
jgi:hypothetical protein